MHDAGGMACKVTARAKSGLYRIETEYITDPARNTVLMRVELKPHDSGYRLYVRFDPTVNGNGGGGAGNGGADSATIDDSTGHPVLVASDPVTATNAVNRDYAQPVYAALDGSFSEASSGFVGTASDAHRRRGRPTRWAATSSRLRGSRLNDGKTVLALGFGASQAEAVARGRGLAGRRRSTRRSRTTRRAGNTTTTR